MTVGIRRVAMVSMHTSPAAAPGVADAGGMNVAVSALAAELARLGVEVDLITRASDGQRVVELGERISLHELGPGGALTKAQLAAVADEFGEAVAALARRREYDVIHAHYWLSGLAVLPVALELDVPFVQSFHTLAAMKNRALPVGDRPEPGARARTESYLAGQAAAVIAGSTAEVDCLIDHVGAPAENLWVIPPGVDTGLFSPERARDATAFRKRHGIPLGRPIVALVGRVQPLKGQELAVRAVGAMRSFDGQDPVLVIAGEPTPGERAYLTFLRGVAHELGIDDSVHFVGALDRDELAVLLASAALCVMPSHSETFGLVALEAAASGTPVVASRSSGLSESVADGRSGVLVDGRDPVDWARVIQRLLSDPAVLATLSARARGHAEQFSWAGSSRSLLAVYGGLGHS
ncbi:glycosyltransferase [Ruicaihuangia caeni]|uniref:D-inositol 3-phosphate glycosyltransferase n=1 Tax=Ruicaihuangia caeni TaxID=3042517 RepID=A0AAW6T8H7_9MICO|nr:glycosyltransferase [Klugiella sp. YN-L-19]MDI2097442.1 glycosyltransferase [Klugiella sp. YN-L-19]